MTGKQYDEKIKERGKAGEKYICTYLAKNGYNIICTNYSSRYGEIDVIAENESVIAFVEVKTRKPNSLASGLESITSSKLKKFIKTAADYLAKEKEILLAAAKNEKPNAPEKVINGIVMGRLNKELSEICLMDQVYVKAEDGKQSVQKYVDQVAKANGAKIAIKGFVRYETGEGLEKKQENFAAEVAAQMNH